MHINDFKLTSHKGFTLLEVAIAIVIVGTLTAAVFNMFSHSDKLFDKNKARMELERAGLNVAEAMRNDLTRMTSVAGGDWSLTPNVSFTGKQVIGYDTATDSNLYGSTIIWRIEYGTDIANDIDDDNDGLIDEMDLVRVVDGVSSIKANNVREDSMVLTESGSVITYQFTLDKYVGKTTSTLSFTTTTRKFTLN